MSRPRTGRALTRVEASASDHGTVRAATLALVAFLAGVSAGHAIGGWIAEQIVENNLLPTIVGGASLLTLAGAIAIQGFSALKAVFRSVRTGAGVTDGNLGWAVATLFVVVLLGTVGIEVYLALSEPEHTTCAQIAGAEAGQGVANASSALVAECIRQDLVRLAQQVDNLAAGMDEVIRRVARINAKVAPCPFLFENAKLEEGEARLNGRGVRLEESHRNRLRGVADHLAELARGSRPLAVRVAGYASEAPFRGLPPSESDELNREAANRRADAVAAALRQELGRKQVDAVVEAESWDREEWRKESAGRPSWADSDAVEPRDRWLIGRSVFVHVQDSSSCCAIAGPDQALQRSQTCTLESKGEARCTSSTERVTREAARQNRLPAAWDRAP